MYNWKTSALVRKTHMILNSFEYCFFELRLADSKAVVGAEITTKISEVSTPAKLKSLMTRQGSLCSVIFIMSLRFGLNLKSKSTLKVAMAAALNYQCH